MPDAPRPVWQRIVLTYIGIFVLGTVAFGLVHDLQTGRFVQSVVTGALFGLLMSAILGTTAVVGQRGNPGSWSPRRQFTVDVPDTATVTHRQVLFGLEQLGARVVRDDGTRVSARIGAGWKTWGTRIDVDLRPGSDRTRVDVRIRPRVRSTLIDYGAANRAVEVLTRSLTPVPPAPR